MDTRKLDKWADLLLDTGKRNNLINFKDTRTSTVEVLLPSPAALFEKVDGASSFEVFDPNIAEEDPDEAILEDTGQETKPLTSEEPDAPEARAEFLALYSGKIKRQNQILLYNAVNPLAAVKNIDKKARQFVEETGVNVAYMAFGFIHWKESDSSGRVFRAPVLLVPVQLEQESAVDPYIIRSAEENIIANPTFSYKLDAEYGIKLPEYDDEGLDAYLEKVQSLVGRLQWTVTSECRIGIFSFLKINMYRDLKDNAEKILANLNIRQLLGEPAETDIVSTGTASPVANPLIELHNVVDADSSQIEAIEMAKSGKSFILQGPPGTGKSQTITNIIAECLNDGKKVLFVSEKLAALNVVYSKLAQAGLAEFCLEIHSHKANKKDVIADICHTLRTAKTSVSSKADTEIAIKERAQRQLDAYAAELHRQHPVIEKSLYQLFDAYASFRTVPDIEYPVPGLASKGGAYLTETSLLLEQYADYIPSIGYDYRKNPWYGYISQDTTYQAKNAVRSDLDAAVRFFQALIPLQHMISEKYGIQCSSIEDYYAWKAFFDFAATSGILTPALLDRVNFGKADAALGKMEAQCADVLEARAKVDAVSDDNIYKLDGEELSKKLTIQFGGFFSRLFNSDYKQIVTSLHLCRKDGKKPSYKEACAMAENLASYQQKDADFSSAAMLIGPLLGGAYKGTETEWAYVREQMSALRTILSATSSFGALGSYHEFGSEREAFAGYHQQFESLSEICDAATTGRIAGYFDRTILDILSAPCEQVLARMTSCLWEMDRLDNWCHFRSLLAELDEKQVVPYLHSAISQNLEPEHIAAAFKKQFYYQWTDLVLSESPVLSAFSRISQDKAIDIFSEKDVEQFEISKAKIRAGLSSMRPSLDVIASGSALAVLLREGEKKRKQKSIRSLLAETGDLVQRIKPCFLMSPLSVSTFLAPDSVHFDVVIFDEASQIFPQDAVGAIYRAAQAIVVGDSKQMPPSNFFNASLEAEDSDEETGDITDFESVLDICSATMQQLRLCWHYRSRYEQLISFSNKNFYDSQLVTFPSSRADAPGTGVDYYHVDGLFDRKAHTNRKEAEFIVDLIYQNFEKYPDRSLGVVAFSMAQQDLIDRLLSRRRQNTPEKEYFFRNSASEPFFIKNLETVQGDERDTIIFSVAYGIDAQGRLLHNFGPLNRVGGERRLNVAVTRAKINVQVVSSMHYTDIDLSRTKSEGARLLRGYLDYAENGNIALERSVTVSPFEQFDSEFELEVCDCLRANGYSVDTQVGCSGFRIDLGLKKPDSSDYVLAIECDGATYHSSKNARDRDRLRQQILERMGWNFYRIWSTDWFRNKSVEQERLLQAAAEAVRKAAKTEAEPEICQQSQEMTEDGGMQYPEVRVCQLAASKPSAGNLSDSKPAETFEVAAAEQHLEFPAYKAADVHKLAEQYLPKDFKGMIRAILEIEAPLSEELLLKRIVWCFDREKVTSVVQRAFTQQMRGYRKYGIERRNGFLYLDSVKEFVFRGPGDIDREIRQIAPEELAAGLFEILKQNVTADKNALYRSLAAQYGVTRLGRAVMEAMEAAMLLLRDRVEIDGEQVSVR
ncbi:MAG: DUF4011 domain-containing protein [Desulfovibrionaceae bacterium]|nr:DUF4011 domain-containing protein [Desulfovibrionaceae bacterium]